MVTLKNNNLTLPLSIEFFNALTMSSWCEISSTDFGLLEEILPNYYFSIQGIALDITWGSDSSISMLYSNN